MDKNPSSQQIHIYGKLLHTAQPADEHDQ